MLVVVPPQQSPQLLPQQSAQSSPQHGGQTSPQHGSAVWQQAMRSLAKNGRLVTCGATTGPKVEIDLRFFFTQQHCIMGAYMGARHELLQCLRLLERRVFQPVVDSVFPLEKLREAQERMARREMFGKIVITP